MRVFERRVGSFAEGEWVVCLNPSGNHHGGTLPLGSPRQPEVRWKRSTMAEGEVRCGLSDSTSFCAPPPVPPPPPSCARWSCLAPMLTSRRTRSAQSLGARESRRQETQMTAAAILEAKPRAVSPWRRDSNRSCENSCVEAAPCLASRDKVGYILRV